MGSAPCSPVVSGAVASGVVVETGADVADVGVVIDVVDGAGGVEVDAGGVEVDAGAVVGSVAALRDAAAESASVSSVADPPLQAAANRASIRTNRVGGSRHRGRRLSEEAPLGVST